MSTPMPRPAPVTNQTFFSLMSMRSFGVEARCGGCRPRRNPGNAASAAVWESLLVGGTGRDPLVAGRRPSLVRVDTRKDLREFLISRRAKVTPQQAGLPTYGGHRRVPGLRREEVSLLAGVSVEYYTRLERGNAQGVSDSRARGPRPRAAAGRGGAGPPVRPRARGRRHDARPPSAAQQRVRPGRAAAPGRDDRRPGVRPERAAGRPGHQRAGPGPVLRPVRRRRRPRRRRPPAEPRPLHVPRPARRRTSTRTGTSRRGPGSRCCAPRRAGARTTGCSPSSSAS